jgi:hypothetical protein
MSISGTIMVNLNISDEPNGALSISARARRRRSLGSCGQSVPVNTICLSRLVAITFNTYSDMSIVVVEVVEGSVSAGGVCSHGSRFAMAILASLGKEGVRWGKARGRSEDGAMKARQGGFICTLISLASSYGDAARIGMHVDNSRGFSFAWFTVAKEEGCAYPGQRILRTF